MSKVVGVARINLPITDEFIEGVLETAYDPGYGGARYWSYTKRAQGETTEGNIKDLASGRRKIITIKEFDPDFPDDPEVSHELSRSKLIRGVERWVAFMMERKRWKDWMLDPGNIDAEYADMIMQFALFKTLQYG